MHYCSACGSSLVLRVPDGDTLPRHMCSRCGSIHYQNPRLVVGCIPRLGERVLLCRRSIEPRRGYWTLPAGFMENGETTQQAAARETLEEACARVRVGALYTLFNLPRHNQVYLIFLGQMLDADFGAGAESLEARLFAEEDLPWNEIAFHAVDFALAHYFRDLREGALRFRIGDLGMEPGNPAVQCHAEDCRIQEG